MYTESQIPRSKLRGIKLVSQQSCGVFDPRGSRQMNMLACPLGSWPAGINLSYFVEFDFGLCYSYHQKQLVIFGNS